LLEVIRYLEAFCFDIPFRLLVNMIVGTSIGGIVALGCVVRDPVLPTSAMIGQFESTLKTIFPARSKDWLTTVYEWLQGVTYGWRVKYNSPETELKRFFGETSKQTLRRYNSQPSAFAAAVAVNFVSKRGDGPVLFSN